jgi:hypothetical protein
MAAVRFDFSVETFCLLHWHLCCLLMRSLNNRLCAFPNRVFVSFSPKSTSFLNNVARIQLLGPLFLTLHEKVARRICLFCVTLQL